MTDIFPLTHKRYLLHSEEFMHGGEHASLSVVMCGSRAPFLHLTTKVMRISLELDILQRRELLLLSLRTPTCTLI